METNRILSSYWGYSSFYPGQEQAIEAALAGKDSLVLLPTGGGKSLCFQIPTLARQGTCLVISPLIALMKDQVDGLLKKGIPAASIHQMEAAAAWEAIYNQWDERPLKFLYLTAERLASREFEAFIDHVEISLIAVDEAHCISQWGHDFRPAYRQIGAIRRHHRLQGVPMMALTATATAQTEADIIEQLSLRKPVCIRQSYERKNIFYQVQYSEDKEADLFQFLEDQPGTGIIYTGTRSLADSWAEKIQAQGRDCLVYHAGMDGESRIANQKRWLESQGTLMVATSAFGMGIDMPHVRFVVHLDLPFSIEQYYQETGRAGRDGNRAMASLFFTPDDIPRLRAIQEERVPTLPVLQRVYQSICDYLQIPIGAAPDRFYPFDFSAFCQRFALSPARTWYALEFLERAGFWTLVDTPYRPPQIQLHTAPSLGAEFQKAEPEVWALLKALWRWRGDLYERPAPISLRNMSASMGLDTARLLRRIERAQALGLLQWHPALEGSYLHVHHYRVESQHLRFPPEALSKIRQIHRDQSEAFIEYIDRPGECRNQFLLLYFGQAAPSHCGHCDLCVSGV